MRKLLFFLSIAVASSQLPPYPHPLKPSSVTYSSIHDVNLRKVLGIKPDGLFPEKDPDGGRHYERRLQSIHYLPGPSSSKNVAVLVFSSWQWLGASSDSGGTAEVYDLSPAKRLRKISTFEWDTHGNLPEPPGGWFDARTRTLVTRSAILAESDPHCCPSAYGTDTYHWNGIAFVRVSQQSTPMR